jgi:hypothetical protein
MVSPSAQDIRDAGKRKSKMFLEIFSLDAKVYVVVFGCCREIAIAQLAP